MSRNPEGVAEAIRKAQSIALCSHVNPDGDTIGCSLAMRLGLLSLGKTVSVFCEDKVPDNLMMLPGAETVRRPQESEEVYDLFLALDVSTPERLGSGGQAMMERCLSTAQIDHHPTNPLYARVNSVDGKAPAACVLIREQLRTLGVPLTKDLAECLYTGLSTDTGNFSYAATTAEVFEIMAELMGTGFPLAELSRILFQERSREQVLLMGKAFSHLTFQGKGKIAVMTLTREDFEQSGALEEHSDGLINYGLDTPGTEMAVMAREAGEGKIKFSLRTKAPRRVDLIAERLGGGGHAQASGVTLAGSLVETLKTVLAEMEKELLKTE